MTGPRRARTIAAALERKGFVAEQGHRTVCQPVVDGKRRSIHTYLSHGIDEYGPALLARMRKQLGFPDSASLSRFIDCDLGYDDYVRLLREAGEID